MDNPDTAVGVRASQRYQAVTPVGNSNRMPSRRMYSKQPLFSTRFKYQQALFIIKVPSSPSPLTKGLSGSFLQSFLSCFSLSTAIPLIAKRTFALEVSLAGSPKRTFALDLALFPKTERERSFLSWSQRQHKRGRSLLSLFVVGFPAQTSRWSKQKTGLQLSFRIES